MIKRFLSFVLFTALLLSLLSCADEDTVIVHCEFRLSLPNGYDELESDVYDVLVTNGEYMIAVTRISFWGGMHEGIPQTMSEVEFAEFYLEKCSRNANIIKDGVTYAEYYSENGEAEHFCLEAFYRSPDAYFVVLFASHVSREETARPVFLDLAEEVTFTN